MAAVAAAVAAAPPAEAAAAAAASAVATPTGTTPRTGAGAGNTLNRAPLLGTTSERWHGSGDDCAAGEDPASVDEQSVSYGSDGGPLPSIGDGDSGGEDDNPRHVRRARRRGARRVDRRPAGVEDQLRRTGRAARRRTPAASDGEASCGEVPKTDITAAVARPAAPRASPHQLRVGCAPGGGRGRCSGGTHRLTVTAKDVAGSTAGARSAAPRATPHQRRDGCAPSDGRCYHGVGTHRLTATAKNVAGSTAARSMTAADAAAEAPTGTPPRPSAWPGAPPSRARWRRARRPTSGATAARPATAAAATAVALTGAPPRPSAWPGTTSESPLPRRAMAGRLQFKRRRLRGRRRRRLGRARRADRQPRTRQWLTFRPRRQQMVLVEMRARGLRIGRLVEMPADGKVGVDPVCVLGLNMNGGEEIWMRVRTDDGQGSLSWWKVLEVVWNELSHNVFGAHDARCYAPMREIASEGEAFSASRGGGASPRLGGGVRPRAGGGGGGRRSGGRPRSGGGGANGRCCGGCNHGGSSRHARFAV
ncbi:hypothetical protein BU14_0992s0006 [Porphyra umbilicalis]|uniref:WLM domain-containing protein n=1 Tax=Porphyra umbilicalis TaxID=2786 RepID=A0A1X6NMY4_PORUM|nr:hypothetical protein BU14_0992s0006 [Porphyra umbilicalis]|eukprot:OSX69947.1 hypothetical protein BU14_0992s0006 [Porphyra umbilicalis]